MQPTCKQRRSECRSGSCEPAFTMQFEAVWDTGRDNQHPKCCEIEFPGVLCNEPLSFDNEWLSTRRTRIAQHPPPQVKTIPYVMPYGRV